MQHAILTRTRCGDFDRVSYITGVPAADIERLARDMATISPSFIRVNYGLQRHGGGGMAVRTIVCLPAILGSWRHVMWPDGWTAVTSDGRRTAQFEHTVLVTENGHEILTLP